MAVGDTYTSLGNPYVAPVYNPPAYVAPPAVTTPNPALPPPTTTPPPAAPPTNTGNQPMANIPTWDASQYDMTQLPPGFRRNPDGSITADRGGYYGGSNGQDNSGGTSSDPLANAWAFYRRLWERDQQEAALGGFGNMYNTRYGVGSQTPYTGAPVSSSGAAPWDTGFDAAGRPVTTTNTNNTTTNTPSTRPTGTNQQGTGAPAVNTPPPSTTPPGTTPPGTTPPPAGGNANTVRPNYVEQPNITTTMQNQAPGTNQTRTTSVNQNPYTEDTNPYNAPKRPRFGSQSFSWGNPYDKGWNIG